MSLSIRVINELIINKISKLEQRLEDNEINFTDKLHELSLQIERLTEDNMVLNNLKYASNREISDTYPPGLMDPHTKKIRGIYLKVSQPNRLKPLHPKIIILG